MATDNYEDVVLDVIRRYNPENKYIVAGFPGVGKSTAAEMYPDEFIDMESSDYHWVVDGHGNKTQHPDWPNNYIDAIEQTFNNTKVTGTILCVCCSTHNEVLKELSNRGLKFIAVAPKTKEYVIERYVERNSPKSFINLLDNNFDKFISDVWKSDASFIIMRDAYLTTTMACFADK